MLRRAFAVLLALHGIAHVLGFLGLWRLAEFKDVPYTTFVLNGSVNVGDSGARIVGLLWLVAAAAFIVAARATWRGGDHWKSILVVVAGFSLAMCLIGLPSSGIGVGIDVLILAGFVVQVAWRSALVRPVTGLRMH